MWCHRTTPKSKTHNKQLVIMVTHTSHALRTGKYSICIKSVWVQCCYTGRSNAMQLKSLLYLKQGESCHTVLIEINGFFYIYPQKIHDVHPVGMATIIFLNQPVDGCSSFILWPFLVTDCGYTLC